MTIYLDNRIDNNIGLLEIVGVIFLLLWSCWFIVVCSGGDDDDE